MIQTQCKANAFGGTFAKPLKPTHKPSFAKEPPSQRSTKNRQEMTTKQTTEKEGRRHNISYTQAGVSCFVGQESAKFEVQFFVA